MNTNTSISERIEALRSSMKALNVQAYIIPSSDGHLSEYTPAHWKGRTWISGFTGSAGTVVITLDKAGLWTDSRYFLQGAQQIEGTPLTLFKEGVTGVPSIEKFLATELPKGAVVGCDGNCFSQAEIERMETALAPFGIALDAKYDLLEKAWTDRPAIPTKEFFSHPEKYSGEATQTRTQRILSELKSFGANAIVLTMLDELAWAFNIRGNDVECNPVGVGYGFIGEKESVLFAIESKVSDALKEELRKQGVRTAPYEEIFSYLSQLSEDTCVLIDKMRMTHSIYESLSKACGKVYATSVVTLLKSYKNEVELGGVRRSMLRDGVALTRFFIWLEKTLGEGATPSEVEVGEKLTSFRAADAMYVCDSFDTICGYQDHGAIVHYRAEESTAHKVKNEGVLLLDSGGQYLDGTTDITRTVALGKEEPEAQLKRDYTLVLKGHIAIATAQFPEGTRGNQLDILARKALWDQGLSYGHGTGHGVGVFLNVHEGPQNIRTDNNPTPMAIGTFTSNEPGLYRSGKYGIRIENLIVTREKCRTEFGTFLGFETMTLCFLDNRLVEKSLLTSKEIEWYNDYQERVYQALSPLLTAEEATWLRGKTQKL